MRLPSGEVAIVMADIVGKGIPAALLRASLHGSLQAQCTLGFRDLGRLLSSVNRHIYNHTDHERYATLFFGCYDDCTWKLRYVNCGHSSPLLLRHDDRVERLETTATVLGLFLDWKCSVAETDMKQGYVLSIYTDGITETIGHSEEEFGEARLLSALGQRRTLDAAAILQPVEESVAHFRSGDQHDDLSLIIARGR